MRVCKMKNLFVIYIGGSCDGSLIELHDMRLVISETIEASYDTLKKSWWGTATSLHLDAWGILRYADGYRIEIVEDTTPEDTGLKLYFVNLGGYDQKQFTELHKNVFVVAENEQAAKLRAVAQIQDWESPHRDYLFDVDTVLNVSDLLDHRIKLVKDAQESPFEFTCAYVPIGKTS